MRVHVVILDAAPYQMAFLRRLRNAGFDVCDWTIRAHDADDLWRAAPDSRRWSRNAFSAAVRQSDVAIVHGYSPWPLPVVLAIASRKCGTVVLRSDAGIQATRRHGPAVSAVKGVINRWIAKAVDYCAVVGQDGARHYQEFGVGPEKVIRSPFDVDQDVYFPEPTSERRSRVVFVGRLHPHKNLHRLLSAFASARLRSRGWSLLVVGDGPEKGRLVQLAERLGISGAVEFAGPVRDQNALARLIRESAALALPSLREKFGVALLEGASCGLALLASTRAGASHELIEEGRSGFLINPEDVESIVHGLDGIADCWEDLGARARELATTYLNSDELVQTLLRVGR